MNGRKSLSTAADVGGVTELAAVARDSLRGARNPFEAVASRIKAMDWPWFGCFNASIIRPWSPGSHEVMKRTNAVRSTQEHSDGAKNFLNSQISAANIVRPA